MTGQDGHDGRLLSLTEGFARSGLTFAEAWTEYLTMGGNSSRERVAAALRGEETLGSYEYNKLATALNEFYVEFGKDHPVKTRDTGTS